MTKSYTQRLVFNSTGVFARLGIRELQKTNRPAHSWPDVRARYDFEVI